MTLRNEIIQAAITHAEAHIEKHRINVEVFLRKSVGVAGHSDIIDTIELELEQMAKYQDQVDILNNYF
jgi:hypothetical protein